MDLENRACDFIFFSRCSSCRVHVCTHCDVKGWKWDVAVTWRGMGGCSPLPKLKFWFFFCWELTRKPQWGIWNSLPNILMGAGRDAEQYGGKKTDVFISEHRVYFIFEDAFDFDSIMTCLSTTFTPISGHHLITKLHLGGDFLKKMAQLWKSPLQIKPVWTVFLFLLEFSLISQFSLRISYRNKLFCVVKYWNNVDWENFRFLHCEFVNEDIPGNRHRT